MNERIGNYNEQEPKTWIQGLFEESATQKYRLGTVRRLDDGRWYRYGKLTAAAIATAGVLVSKVQTPVDATIAAADALLALAGTRHLSVTAAAVTAAQFVDGFAVVKAGTDIGCMYKIRGNGATDGIATGRVALELYDKLYQTWVAASTTVALHANPWKDILLNPAVANEAATTQERVVGMTIRPMTASYYGWFQTKGPACLVLDIDAAAGAEANEMVVVPGTTAGRGAVIADTAYAGGVQIIGHTYESADLTDAEGNFVNLCIE